MSCQWLYFHAVVTFSVDKSWLVTTIIAQIQTTLSTFLTTVVLYSSISSNASHSFKENRELSKKQTEKTPLVSIKMQ